MNRQKLQTLASEWVRVAKSDIRGKVMDFMREVDTTPRELAYVLAISDEELEQILRGNCEITLTTFAKLLIATGNALEIKPIEETPIGDYDNIPDEPIEQPNVFSRPTNTQQPTHGHFAHPQPNVFSRPKSTQQPTQDHFNRPLPPFDRMPQNPQQPHLGHFKRMPFFPPNIEDIPEEIREEINARVQREQQPRDAHGRFAPRVPHTEQPREDASPFAHMSREEKVNIIKERLWDSEIDVDNVSDEQLVRFLNEKDKRMKEYKRMRDIESDPKVNEFKNKLKNTVNTNPHLREWVKKFVGEL